MDLINSHNSDAHKMTENGQEWINDGHDPHSWFNSDTSADPTDNNTWEKHYVSVDEQAEGDFSLLDELFESPNRSFTDAVQTHSHYEEDGNLPWAGFSPTVDGSNSLPNSEQQDRSNDSNTDEAVMRSKPTLSRRKSNPFYSPSQQIQEMVKKRKRSRTATVMRSQSSATILTLRKNENLGANKTINKVNRSNTKNDNLKSQDLYRRIPKMQDHLSGSIYEI